jgi:hypothetical protein
MRWDEITWGDLPAESASFNPQAATVGIRGTAEAEGIPDGVSGLVR